jgi:hypothetical protein
MTGTKLCATIAGNVQLRDQVDTWFPDRRTEPTQSSDWDGWAIAVKAAAKLNLQHLV